jgi:ferritin-like metal-binding protein YciE
MCLRGKTELENAMKLTSEHFKSLHPLYITQLQKTLDMEQQITKALPNMIEKATSPELKQAFEMHLGETQTHVARVQSILERHEDSAETITCKAIAALVSETKDGIKDADDSDVLDATLIAAGQQVEHHEIAVYGTLRNWAEVMGHAEDIQLLESTLREEKAADEKLTQISKTTNAVAA